MTTPSSDVAQVCADLADLSRRLRDFEDVDPSEIEAFKARVADLLSVEPTIRGDEADQ